MTVVEASSRAAGRLSSAGIPDASLEAEVLLRHTLDMDRVGYFSSLTQAMSGDEEERVSLLVQRRISGEPLAYILGHREFYGLDFIVDSNVLVPRQETESLVGEVIEFVRSRPDEQVTIADIGTGSGAIAVALAGSLPAARLLAVDTSRAALGRGACQCRPARRLRPGRANIRGSSGSPRVRGRRHRVEPALSPQIRYSESFARSAG